ncbi:M14 family metallopeptidase [Shewanella gelidii]
MLFSRSALGATLVTIGLTLPVLTATATPHSNEVTQAHGNSYVNDTILPPLEPWQGNSEQLMVDANDPWATPFEQSQGFASPNYDDTIAWLDKLIATSPMLSKVSLGLSPQGRDIWMIIASQEGANSPETLSQNNKPTILVQAGIHSGEIDGKDAGMMLLRDIVFANKQHLLADANLLFVPIFSVDGHERSGQYNRVNQRGPENMGWRTTATNLNLNRDYAKADSPEMQHMIRAINRWNPSLYIDVHVTDGIDYQYDLTLGYNLKQGLSPASYAWLEHAYKPAIYSALTAAGHIPGELVFAKDNTDINQGFSLWNPSPRFSNGYGDARHLPTILIENHSLKPFRQRVLATYVMLESTLELMGTQATTLKSAITQDSYRYPKTITVKWGEEQQSLGRDFKGIDYSLEHSPISGNKIIRWNGKPKSYINLPVHSNTKPLKQVSRPEAYYIPAQWQQVIERLDIHGIRMQVLQQSTKVSLSQYRIDDFEFQSKDYEGRQRVSVNTNLHTMTTTLPAGTVKINTKQPLGDLAIMLLEPESRDSLLQWGFFNPIFTRTEYIENYAVEPMAAKMLADDPALAKEFQQALANASFAQDPKARLRWFYQRSPYYDQAYLAYPVLRSH